MSPYTGAGWDPCLQTRVGKRRLLMSFKHILLALVTKKISSTNVPGVKILYNTTCPSLFPIETHLYLLISNTETHSYRVLIYQILDRTNIIHRLFIVYPYIIIYRLDETILIFLLSWYYIYYYYITRIEHILPKPILLSALYLLLYFVTLKLHFLPFTSTTT